MTSNFSYLKQNPKFREFAAACIEAEQSFSPATTNITAIAVRRALEVTVKWLYKVEEELEMPYKVTLSAMVHNYSFKELVDRKLSHRIRFIIDLGNKAAHTGKRIGESQVKVALSALYDFVSWVDYSYSPVTHDLPFDDSLLGVRQSSEAEEKLKALEAEAQKLREEKEALEETTESLASELEKERKSKAERQEFTAQRKEKEAAHEFHCDDINEFETRKIYIDLALEMAGWKLQSNCLFEVEVTPMPNPSNKGFADYVLYDDNGKPLALVEAKKTAVDPRNGKQQAKLYADALEDMTGTRPLIFYTNGFETYFWDDREGAPRLVSGFFSKEELQWLNFRKKNRKSLQDIEPNPAIAGRPYQLEAITRTCEGYERGERKALLVMATGTGKTRTAVSLVDQLIKQGWVKNALFLADRRELVKQAKQSFKALLPNLTMCNLLDKGDDVLTNRMIFSTYPTMMNAIDTAKSEDGNRLFSPAHFDLIIVDEAHRSIYKKYQDIFDYFDGMLFGLTATPHNEIDRNTYSVFELENENPTFAYELDQAVAEGFLVPYSTIETVLKFIDEGIKYDQLSDSDKEHWEETFGEADEFSEIPSEQLHKFLFNSDTVDKVLQNLMEKGLKIEGGDSIGKTIIFAQNQKHANFILERFNLLYPELSKNSFAEVITTHVKYADTLIDGFKDKAKNPRIAISVDMLDTGIDVPEILNLVFFKKVRSKAKFWQMIGRGTRLCENLFGPDQNKSKFLIFDYCKNFEFFRINKNGVEGKVQVSLSEKLFNVRVRIARELQHLDYQTPEYITFRTKLVSQLCGELCAINRDHFRAQLRLEYIDRYSNLKAWENITDLMVEELTDNIAPLIPAVQDDELAKRFDYLMYTIELAELEKVSAPLQISKVVGTAQALTAKGNIASVKKHAQLIEAILTDEHWEKADIFTHEAVREALRDLIKLLESETTGSVFYTNFTDEVKSEVINEGHFSVNDLKNYRDRVQAYLREHQDDIAIFKLRNNRPLTGEDIAHLEAILWEELGTEEEYHKEFGDEPLVTLVAKLVGLDRAAANDYFAEFLQDNSLNANQIDFVNLVINHIVENGGLFDNNVLQKHPFNRYGSIVQLFNGKVDTIKNMMGKVQQLNNRLVM